MTNETTVLPTETIRNFDVFDTVSSSILLIKYDDEDGVFYNVLLNLVLSEEPIQVVTTNTTIIENCPFCAIKTAYTALELLYGDVSDWVVVLDPTGLLIEEEGYSIAEVLEQFDPTDELEVSDEV